MLLGTYIARYVLNCSSLASCQKGRCTVQLIMLGFFLFCFNSRALWNPFLECQRFWQVPDLVSQPKPGWAQRWMTCHPGAGPCSSLNGSGDAGTPLMKLPPKVEALMEHIWIPSRGSCQEPGGGEGHLERGNDCERDKLQPSRLVNQGFRET